MSEPASTDLAHDAHAGAEPAPARAISVLVAALGGEGGGVLTSWIVNAARASDLPVQATSIPGVAQRTGATTYYVELWSQPWSTLNGRAPVLALSPTPGEVDVLAATELLETGRAIRAGLVTPERTLLIASTHRAYTTAEKLAMGDGRFDPERLREAARSRAQQLLLLDLAGLARSAGAPVNAVLAGVLAGCGRLPIAPEAFREGIRAEGKAAAANLRGFEAGLTAATQPGDGAAAASPAPRGMRRVRNVEALLERARAQFPPLAQAVLELGVRRLADFQDLAYAALYLERLATFRASPPALLQAVARHLAVRMSYEDAIRVAQAKTRPERMASIRAEAGAARGDLVAITEFLKPGVEEIADILPMPLARALFALARRFPRLERWRPGMYVRTTTVAGYAKLRALSLLRVWRRSTWRYRVEQRAIETWLEHIARAAPRDEALALEIAECARLIKGYGDTHKRGSGNYARIELELIRPALENGRDSRAAATAIAQARTAALADPEGAALQTTLGRPQGWIDARPD